MATSPVQPNGVHPSTPPASDSVPGATAPTTNAASSTTRPTDPDVPPTSLEDSGEAKRPREARLIHLVLASMGVQSYQERVPLQLLDFAYRYTSSVLSDSIRLSQEGYAGAAAEGRGAGKKSAASGANDAEGVTVTSLRQAIASRQNHTFTGHLPKEFMLEQAAERNRVVLPRIEERGYGVQLPEEKYCLTGTGWGFKDEWDEDEEDDDDDEPVPETNGHATAIEKEDQEMGGVDDEDEEGGGRMEDVFGEERSVEDTSMTQD
ncbi:Hypothetical protein R9X50_00341600 [Acrodontium crateriforme]|uniref:TFIID-31kDa-domain-containing protein n=1 Tax=Acrodontium crateriforme TaxID=150365 RepID=A0AAQ3R9E4_9PEZI|nr:Hypothetical protein R9X50_00341600 [Acrodontium crateriforme]